MRNSPSVSFVVTSSVTDVVGQFRNLVQSETSRKQGLIKSALNICGQTEQKSLQAVFSSHDFNPLLLHQEPHQLRQRFPGTLQGLFELPPKRCNLTLSLNTVKNFISPVHTSYTSPE